MRGFLVEMQNHMSNEKVKLPLRFLRPIQSSLKNNQGKIDSLLKSHFDQWEPAEVIWVAQFGYFVVADGNHRFTSAWLNDCESLWCRISELEEYVQFTGIRILLSEIDKRVEEYEMFYKRCFFLETVDLKYREFNVQKIRSLFY